MGTEFPRTSTIEAADAFVSRMAQMQEEAKAALSHAADEMARCRRDIYLISSPPLRTGFGSQNMRFHHEYILLLFSLFLLHENGLQFFRKHHD